MSGPCLGDITAERRRLTQASELDIAETTGFLSSLPASRFASAAYRKPTGRPYLQPRGGFPGLAKQRALVVALSQAGADFLPLTIDSHTRHNDYSAAAELLAAGTAAGRDLLNGYPLVSHPLADTRALFADLPQPVSLRHGTPDARLLVEYALAAGITEIEGGGLSYTLPYARDYPLDRALAHWQYVDRLCATAGPPGRPIHRESFGPLTATLVPPMITIAVQLAELLLAAEQGVRSFAVSFSQTGSVEQDVALAQVLRSQAGRLLNRFGFSDVQVSLVYHQWMGAFPDDPALAWPLIAISTAISRLIGADKLVIKTADEATGIPSIDSNVAAVHTVRYVLAMFGQGCSMAGSVVEQERTLIDSEVSHLIERVLGQHPSSLLAAVHRSVLAGLIDVPFAPHEQNAGGLITDRGPDRRIRILEPGAVPLRPNDLRTERRLLGTRSAPDGQLWERLLHDVRILA
jgi:methylaspartate mutase epsilon subunit